MMVSMVAAREALVCFTSPMTFRAGLYTNYPHYPESGFQIEVMLTIKRVLVLISAGNPTKTVEIVVVPLCLRIVP